MSLTLQKNEVETFRVGASVFVPAEAGKVFEALRDVRGFPAWAPGVRRVEVLEGGPGPGMVSEWEISALGVTKRVRSVLEVADPPGFLRWSYTSPLRGWGRCVVRERDGGALAEFSTEIVVEEPRLRALARRLPVRGVAVTYVRRALAGLGRAVCAGDDRVLVGPLEP